MGSAAKRSPGIPNTFAIALATIALIVVKTELSIQTSFFLWYTYLLLAVPGLAIRVLVATFPIDFSRPLTTGTMFTRFRGERLVSFTEIPIIALWTQAVIVETMSIVMTIITNSPKTIRRGAQAIGAITTGTITVIVAGFAIHPFEIGRAFASA